MLESIVISAGTTLIGEVTKKCLLSHGISETTSAIIGSVISNQAVEFATHTLSSNQQKRINDTINGIIVLIDKRLDEGKIPRADDFYAPYYDKISPASELLEAILLKVRDEYEHKKQKFYQHLFANMCFEERISSATANSLLKLYEQLSYRQLTLLAYLNKYESIKSAAWNVHFMRNRELDKYYDIYSDCLFLFKVNLFAQKNTSLGIGIGTPDLALSPIGEIICKLLDITIVNTDDINEIKNILDAIQTIIQRNSNK